MNPLHPGRLRHSHSSWQNCARGVAALCCLALMTACSKSPEPIGTARQVYDGGLEPELRVNTFRNIDRLFPTRRVARGETVSELPSNSRSMDNFELTIADQHYNLDEVLSQNNVAAMVILQDGAIAYETYRLGNDGDTRWMSMSVVKSITATLIGAAIKDGYIASIDDRIVRYLPQLQDSAYADVSVRQLLQMTSGVGWNETYTDPQSDRRAMLEAQISQQPGAILELMASLPRVAAPGKRWNYSTGETQVAGALLQAATGTTLADYLSEKIWSRIGMQADASWWLESPDGLEIGGSGLSATLRDYARFGLFLLNDGVVDGDQVLPEGWVREAGARKQVAGSEVEYGYMLWPLHGNSFAAIGIFGQFVFVDPDNNMVAAIWSAQEMPVDSHGVDEYLFLQALSEHFATSGSN